MSSGAPPHASELLRTAVDLVRSAGQITLRWFRSAELAVHQKSDGSPVTEADRAAERFLREELARRYPHDRIVGEEERERPGTSGRTWIIDPIDGTKAFTRGVPLYSNLLALVDERGPALGIIHLPALGQTVFAERGGGCFCNDAPARVSDRTSLEGAYLSTSAAEALSTSQFEAIRARGVHLRTWGDGYGYALVATGRIDAMIDPVIAAWDVAAMPVILREAGGRFSDLGGVERFDGGDGLATNGHLHDELLELLGTKERR